jgi:predicted nucleic acid-binding protein
VSRATLEAAIPAGTPILLDTSTILAYLSGAEAASPAAAIVLDEFVALGRNRAVISAVTVTEALVRPFRAATESGLRAVEAFLGHFPNLEVVPVDFGTARDAARIRALSAAPTPDAVILASGSHARVGIAVANDAGWRRIIERAGLEFELCHLDAHLDR